jgi:phage shock protein A
MTDIVARLRGLGNAPFLAEAADEIERLRGQMEGIREHAYDLTRQVKEMRAEIVRLRVEAGYD